jgi:DNA-binding XRE family transcriptional regulator
MSQGYSLRLRDLNRRAPNKALGVRLGRVCIKHDVPVTVVAKMMGVTRQTVYNWFVGASNPQQSLVTLVESYITQFD